MNSEILSIQYKKAQVFMQNRPRRVTFALHHRLYRSVNLAEDLKILERERYKPAGPLESRVWGERFDQDALQFYMTLVEENFWQMVFSDNWSQFSSIRVTEGALLDSLLYTYYKLVKEGKLLTYSTEIYEEDVCTKPGRKRQRLKENEVKGETIKITFTYFSRTAEELSKVLEDQQGLKITDEDIRKQNPSFIPKIISDAVQSSMTGSTGTFPEWTRQLSLSDDLEEQNKANDLLMPENPPNSPLPQKNHVTLKYTHSETHRPYDLRIARENSQTAREYSHVPLVLRTRHNGLASRPTESISVVGQRLNQNYPPLSTFTTADGEIVFLRNRPSLVHQMSTPRIPRNRFTRAFHLPSVNASHRCKEHKIPNSRRHSLQLRLLESNHLHDVDICKRAFIPRKVEFINVVNPLLSGDANGDDSIHTSFDTDKLRINSSLEKIRPDFVRPPIRRLSPHLPPAADEQVTVNDGKTYVMQKYLQESSKRIGEEHGYQSSDRSEYSSYQQSVRFASDTTDTARSNYAFYKQRMPPDFVQNCLGASGCFVVRKEHVTSSRLYRTVTSLTISKIPEGGFHRWKYSN